MRRLAVLSLLAALVVVASAASRQVPQELSAEDVAAIRTLLVEDYRNAVVAGDVEAAMATYTEQAVEIPSNETAIVGKANIRNRWQEMMPDYDYKTWDISNLNISGIGETAVACSRCTFTSHYMGAEELRTWEGTFAWMLKKKNGSWKMAVFHWVRD